MDRFPQAVQVRGAQGAVVQAVARAALLVPDHAAMVRAHVGVGAGVVDGLHDGVHVQIAGGGQVRRLAEVVVAQILHVAHVHRADAVHLAEVADDGGDVVVGVGAQRAGAQAQRVGGAVVQGDHLVIVGLAVSGLLVPKAASELVGALKKSTKLPIELHNHYTSGVCSMTLMKAVEAGCDIIDTAMSPFAMGTSQAATEVMVEAFKGTEYDTGLDQTLLAQIADYFRPIREKYIKNGLMSTKVMGVNIKTLLYQVPGGMLSNLVNQLTEQHKLDKLEEVLEEVPRVRKDLGEPPLVTPSSQIVGTQAVFNVLMGERYKVATQETKDILLGKYGKTVKPFNPEVVDKVLGDDKKNAITCRPADLLEPQLPEMEKAVAEWKEQPEDTLSYALFPQVATEFFKYRRAQETGVDPAHYDKENASYPV